MWESLNKCAEMSLPEERVQVLRSFFCSISQMPILGPFYFPCFSAIFDSEWWLQ